MQLNDELSINPYLMKYVSVFLLCLFPWIGLYSQSNAYKAQRQKVSNMVDERNSRFEQYQNILSKKSGIFGGKTKKDMQNSIDVLTEIVQTDNAILDETNLLLKSKYGEPQRQSDASSSKQALKAYQDSLEQLQQKNVLLLKKASSLERQKRNYNIVLFILGLIGLALLLPPLVKRNKQSLTS